MSLLRQSGQSAPATTAQRRRLSPARRFSLITVLVAWLLATGVHWDFVQVIGWGRMIVTYTTAQEMSLAEALRYTFSGEASCRVCETVTEAKNADGAASAAPVTGKDDLGKLLLTFSPVLLTAPCAPPETGWIEAAAADPLSPTYPVPVPPPRA